MRLTIDLGAKPLRRALAIGVALVALAAAFVVGKRYAPGGSSSKGGDSTPRGMIKVTDTAQGVSIAYPRTWQRVRSDSPRVVLAAQRSGAAMRLSVSPLEGDLSPEAAKALGEQLKSAIEKEGNIVGFLQDPRPITLNSVPGWYYLYTFVDPSSVQEGIRAHYYLFHGAKMIQLIFQAVPSGEFRAQAQTFDKIADTLRSVPRFLTEPQASPGSQPSEAPSPSR